MRFPAGWVLHRQAARGRGGLLAWRPGLQGTGMQPMQRVPVGRYTHKITGVPLTGGQAQGTITGAGTVTLTAGPHGLGVVWYPAQVTLSTTTGLNGGIDTSTAQVYLGSQGVPITLVASVFSGNGTAALAIPSMTPGQVLIVTWTGGHSGDTAAFNIVGTMDALATE